MKATEFCYWLQGAFELGHVVSLTDEHLMCIRKHLAVVSAADQTGEPQPAIDFTRWLGGGVDFIRGGDADQSGMVRKRLDSIFEHAIDPKWPNSAQLSQIHNGPKPGMRC